MERTKFTPTLDEPQSFFNGSKLRPEVLLSFFKKLHKSDFLLVLSSFTGAWFSNPFSQGESTIVTKGDNQFDNVNRVSFLFLFFGEPGKFCERTKM